MAEEIVASVAKISDLRFIALRYFNVAGAAPDLSRGLRSKQATHLVKVAAEAACGKRPDVQIYGTDYETEDGTCLRDYIHVSDLAEAHVLALNALVKGHQGGVYNCGYGRGASVREVLKIMKEVSGTNFPIQESPRRPGDPARIVANADRLRKDLGWQPKYDSLPLICRSAFEWEKRLT